VKFAIPFVAVAVLFVSLTCCGTTVAPPVGPVATITSLDPLIGTWEKTWTEYPAAWTESESTKSGTHTWDWILSNSHLRELGKDSDGTEYLSVWSYDESVRGFKVSTFQSSGRTLQTIGSWDAESNTFRATGDLGNGITMTITYALKSEDSLEFSFTAKDSQGNLYYDLKGTGKRVEPSADAAAADAGGGSSS
jgi:hypothetical protein